MQARTTVVDATAIARRFFAFALLCAVLALWVGVAQASAADFNPNYVLSDSNFRDVNSMSEAQIQSFLDAQPGILAKLVTPDHSGKPQRVSTIIYDACRSYNISPKVMLVMLQKEQSLLTRKTVDKRTLDRAIGAGCPNATDNRYPGFGNQIWNGARMLDGYGQGKTTSYIPLWSQGKTIKVAEATLTPLNITTFKLFTYNPVIGAKAPYGDLSSQKGQLSGNANFWNIWRRYFGDPTGSAYATEVPKPAAKKKAASDSSASAKASEETTEPAPELRPDEDFKALQLENLTSNWRPRFFSYHAGGHFGDGDGTPSYTTEERTPTGSTSGGTGLDWSIGD